MKWTSDYVYRLYVETACVVDSPHRGHVCAEDWCLICCALNQTADWEVKLDVMTHLPGQNGSKITDINFEWYFVNKKWSNLVFLAATKQLYKWYFPSVCPSVRLSVTPFWQCSPHRIIMKFSGVITNDQCKVHAKGQGQRSKVKVTEVTNQLNRFRTVTPVWIHIWWWNDAYSLMLLRRGALLFFKVIRQISRSHGSKNCRNLT